MILDLARCVFVCSVWGGGRCACGNVNMWWWWWVEKYRIGCRWQHALLDQQEGEQGLVDSIVEED